MYRRSSLLAETPDESNFRASTKPPQTSKFRPSTAANSAVRQSIRPSTIGQQQLTNQNRLTMSNVKFQQNQGASGHAIGSSLVKGSRLTKTVSSRFKLNKEPRFFTKKDNRPLEDRNYQNMIMKNLIEHLASLNCVISEEDLRQPTTKGFQKIFEKTWQFFAPSFTYTTTAKVQEIYKSMGYPFPLHDSTMKTITANHSWWRVIMVALDWLRQLSAYALAYRAENVLFLNTKEDLGEFGANVNFEIFIYYVQCYALKLGGHDDFERIDQHFKEVLTNLREEDNSVESLQEENEKLLEELRMLEVQMNEENQLPDEVNALELDNAKITDYVKDIEDHVQTLIPTIKEAEQQCGIYAKEIVELKDEIARNEAIVQQQEVTQDEVKQIFLAKQTLLSQIRTYQSEIEKLEKEQYKMDIQICNDGSKITAKLNDLKQKAKYLFGCNKLKLDQNWLTHLDVDYSPTDPELLVYCKSKLRPGIEIAKELANQVLHELNADLRSHQETLESLEESLVASKDESQSLDEKLDEINKKINETKEGKNRIFLAKKQELDHLREQQDKLEHLGSMNLQEKQQKVDTLKREYRDKKDNFKNEAKEIMECLKEESLMLTEFWEFYQNLRKDDDEYVKNKIKEIVETLVHLDK